MDRPDIYIIKSGKSNVTEVMFKPKYIFQYQVLLNDYENGNIMCHFIEIQVSPYNKKLVK